MSHYEWMRDEPTYLIKQRLFDAREVCSFWRSLTPYAHISEKPIIDGKIARAWARYNEMRGMFHALFLDMSEEPRWQRKTCPFLIGHLRKIAARIAPISVAARHDYFKAPEVDLLLPTTPRVARTELPIRERKPRKRA